MKTPALPLEILTRIVMAPAGSVFMLNVIHDNDCPESKGTGPCACHPDVELCDLTEGGEQ